MRFPIAYPALCKRRPRRAAPPPATLTGLSIAPPGGRLGDFSRLDRACPNALHQWLHP